MWELDCKESWESKNWCFWTVVLEKTLERPLDSKEIQPVHPGGDQFWGFIRRTDVEAETRILHHLMRRTDSFERIWCGKDWRWEEKGATEDEMVGWHYRLNGHELGKLQELVMDRAGLVCCSPWDRKELDTTEQLNWTEHRILGL